MRQQTTPFAFALAVMLMMASPVHANSKSDFTLSAGYNYSTGDYGQDVSTQVHFVPVTGKWIWGNWSAKLMIPWLSITGPGVVVSGTPVGTARAKNTESGLGDITPSLTWTHRLNPSGTTAEISGILKLPTADEDRRLGTGLTDITFQAGLIQPLGKAYLHANGGRKFNGSSTDFPLQDVWKATAGAGYKITSPLTVGLLYDYRQAQTTGGDSMKMLTAYGSYKFTEEWSVQLYGSTGFSDAAPDASIGLQLGRNFDFW